MKAGNAFLGDRDVYLFGAGMAGKNMLQDFMRRGWPVTAFLDSNHTLHDKTVLGVPVLDPAAFLSLPPENFFIIISATPPHCEEMDLMCRNAGLAAWKDYLPYRSGFGCDAMELLFIPGATGGSGEDSGRKGAAALRNAQSPIPSPADSADLGEKKKRSTPIFEIQKKENGTAIKIFGFTLFSRTGKTDGGKWPRRIEARLQEVEATLHRTEKTLKSVRNSISPYSLATATTPQFTELKRMFYGSVISDLCNDLSGIDEEKETFIVFAHRFPLLSHFVPLLQQASDAGMQIIILFSPVGGNFDDKEAHKIFSLGHKVIFLHPYPYNTLSGNKAQRTDFSLPLYYLLHKCDVRAILTDEIHAMPISGFLDGLSYDPSLMPPIYAFKHNVDSSRITYMNPSSSGFTPFLKYCRKYFVWGEIYKRELQKIIDWEIREGKTEETIRRERDKIFCGGWSRMDSLRNLKTSRNHSAFIVGSSLHDNFHPNFDEVIRCLLEKTDYTVYAKRHPGDNSNFSNVRHLESDRFVIMNNHCDYLPTLASCDFSISRISSIMLESLALRKPHIVLHSTSAHHDDPVYDPMREFLFYDNRERFDISAVLDMVASQKKNWDKIDKILSLYISHRFTASENIFQAILNDSREFVPFSRRVQKA